MFPLFIKTALVLIIVLVVLFLIWLISFVIHIVRDEISVENKQTYSSKSIDFVVNNISAIGLRMVAKIYQFFHRG